MSDVPTPSIPEAVAVFVPLPPSPTSKTIPFPTISGFNPLNNAEKLQSVINEAETRTRIESSDSNSARSTHSRAETIAETVVVDHSVSFDDEDDGLAEMSSSDDLDGVTFKMRTKRSTSGEGVARPGSKSQRTAGTPQRGVSVHSPVTNTTTPQVTPPHKSIPVPDAITVPALVSVSDGHDGISKQLFSGVSLNSGERKALSVKNANVFGSGTPQLDKVLRVV